MDASWLKANWALSAAIVPVAIVLAALIRGAWRNSARGRLALRYRQHLHATRELERTKRRASAVERRLKSLIARADRVKPRTLKETRERAEDLRTLLKIADDKCQITANLLRKVIFEEYPPARHEALRRRYLPGDVADGRPFSF